MSRDVESPSVETRASHLIKTELVISAVLRYGVILCSTVIAAGLASRLLHLGSVSESSRQIISALRQGEVLNLEPIHAPGDFIEGVAGLHPDAIMALGLILLIALPIVRVGMTVVLFLFERDWAFLLITLIVFSVLIFGVIFGKAL